MKDLLEVQFGEGHIVFHARLISWQYNIYRNVRVANYDGQAF